MSDGVGASQTALKDRRKGVRYQLDWPTRMMVAGSGVSSFEEAATLRDVSSRGAFVYLQNAPPLGSKIFVAIKLPVEKETWMMYSARVVRVEQRENEVGVAVGFDTSRPKFAKRLDWKSFKGI